MSPEGVGLRGEVTPPPELHLIAGVIAAGGIGLSWGWLPGIVWLIVHWVAAFARIRSQAA